MNSRKKLLSKLWKLIPVRLRWGAIWAVSPRFIVGVAGIVLNGAGEVLLARHVYRGNNPWGLPGGIIQRGESLVEGLQREILEETRLEVEVGPLLQVGIGRQWPHVTFQFLCTLEGAAGASPRLAVSDELFEAGFYPLDALPCALEPVQASAVARAREILQHPEIPISVCIVQTE